MENAVGEIYVMPNGTTAEHQMTDLVGRIPQQRIGERIADECAEHGGNDAAADRPCDQGSHHHVGTEEGCCRGKYARGETERHGMRRFAQAPQAVDDIAARAAPAPARPEMHADPLEKTLRLAAPEQHRHLSTDFEPTAG